MSLIPQSDTGLEGKKRKCSGELEPRDYVQLELEAYKRQTTPYKLVSAVVTAFVRGALVESGGTSASPSPSPSVAEGS